MAEPGSICGHDRAPTGWWCSRAPGHEGPCAARRDYEPSVSTQNQRGEWVPAIPLPLLGLRKRCSCGAKFWTRAGYDGHYALEHILGLGSRP